MKSKWTHPVVLSAISELANKIGRFPTLSEIDGVYPGIHHYFDKTSTSIHKIANELGYEPTQKPKGYWTNFDNLKNELQPLINSNNGKFPTQSMIESNLGTSARGIIYKYHGSLPAVAKKMGYTLDSFFQATDGHYVNSANEYLLDEFLYEHGIKHSVGGLISDTHQYCYDFKVDDYYIEIWGYEEHRINKICERYKKKRAKKEELYEKLGLKLISINSTVFKQPLLKIREYFIALFTDLGYKLSENKQAYDIVNHAKHCYYWSEDKILKGLSEYITTTNEFPSKGDLYENGQGDLADAIYRFGGYVYFREKMGFAPSKRPDGYWNNQTICDELKPLINDSFPMFQELEALGRHDLIRAINKHGGIVKFRKLFGFEEARKPNGYYTPETIKRELAQFIKKLDHVPTYSETRKVNKVLASAIDRSKLGYNNLINELGYEPAGRRGKKLLDGQY